MLERPKGAPLQPPGSGIEVVRALEPTVSFYRYLYDTVGADWLWTRRRLLDDADLAAIIRDPGVDIRVLWCHGVPAGFAELDVREAPDVELAYFGLIPEFIGRGLGRYLLDWAVRHAWTRGAGRLWVHTCDLDHPRAVATYEAAGFELYDRDECEETVMEGMALPAHAAERPVRWQGAPGESAGDA